MFKVGDRVLDMTLSREMFTEQQCKATVVDCNEGKDRIRVKWDDKRLDDAPFWDEKDFKLIEEKKPESSNNPLLTILDETFDNARRLIIEKGGEYAADTDVLANFRHEGEKLGLPMEVIWHVYIGKHLSAIDRYIRDIKDDKTDRPRMETLESRADDIITYMVHFKMMLKERGI